MANKTQAKAAVDAATVAIKSDIDNILPVGVDITDGAINFAPTRWGIKLNGGSEANAVSVANAIAANLTTAGRANSTVRGGRRLEDGTAIKSIAVSSVLATYQITYT